MFYCIAIWLVLSSQYYEVVDDVQGTVQHSIRQDLLFSCYDRQGSVDWVLGQQAREEQPEEDEYGEKVRLVTQIENKAHAQ